MDPTPCLQRCGRTSPTAAGLGPEDGHPPRLLLFAKRVIVTGNSCTRWASLHCGDANIPLSRAKRSTPATGGRHDPCVSVSGRLFKAVGRGESMNNVFYIIGVVVVIMVVLGYLGLR